MTILSRHEPHYVHLTLRRVQARADSRSNKLHLLVDVCGGGMANFMRCDATRSFRELSRSQVQTVPISCDARSGLRPRRSPAERLSTVELKHLMPPVGTRKAP